MDEIVAIREGERPEVLLMNRGAASDTERLALRADDLRDSARRVAGLASRTALKSSVRHC